MSDQKNYVVQWRYCDTHHCDFREKLHFNDVDEEGVLEQFKKSEPWREYSSGLFPNSYGEIYFSYQIEKVEDLSGLVTDSEN